MNAEVPQQCRPLLPLRRAATVQPLNVEQPPKAQEAHGHGWADNCCWPTELSVAFNLGAGGTACTPTAVAGPNPHHARRIGAGLAGGCAHSSRSPERSRVQQPWGLSACQLQLGPWLPALDVHSGESRSACSALRSAAPAGSGQHEVSCCLLPVVYMVTNLQSEGCTCGAAAGEMSHEGHMVQWIHTQRRGCPGSPSNQAPQGGGPQAWRGSAAWQGVPRAL